MSTTMPSRFGNRRLQRFNAALHDWINTDGRTWIYVFKAVGAALLALGLAMRLELNSPRTAMTTVFIVMQPFSGQVYAKGFYRILGTIAGSAVTLLLVALFAQTRELFLVALALWIAVCTAGAARNRNARSYGFVLAGYTAALVGIPAALNPMGAFDAAVTRVTEVSLGVICAGVVSAIVFPLYASELVRNNLRARFTGFLDFIAAALGGQLDRQGLEQSNVRFVADVIGLEALRSFAVFEDPEARRRGGQIERINSEFMIVSTRFHALHQLLNRLHAARGAPAQQAVAALQPYFTEVTPLLTHPGSAVLDAAAAARVAQRLDAFRSTLPARMRTTRAALQQDAAAPLPDFDTGAELLYRFVEDLHAYALTYAALAAQPAAGTAAETSARQRNAPRPGQRYVPKTSALAAGIHGMRAALVVLTLGTFWIVTAWPSGPTLTLLAAAICAIASSAPQPGKMASSLGLGAILSMVVGFFVTYGVLPHIDGFPMLCLVFAPLLALGVFFSTRPQSAGIGAGFCVFLAALAGPDNLTHYDAAGYLNDGLAMVGAVLATSVAFSVVMPPAGRWLRARLLRALLAQVVLACRGRLAGLAHRFESGTRDMLSQSNALVERSDAQRTMLAWAFTVLEIGHAVIELRRDLTEAPATITAPAGSDGRVGPGDAAALQTLSAARNATLALLEALIALFSQPTAVRLAAAQRGTDTALGAAQRALSACLRRPLSVGASNSASDNDSNSAAATARAETPAQREARRRLQRVLSYLHFIRSALLDPQAPLAEIRDAAAAFDARIAGAPDGA